jgi:hypothetical protein
MVKPPLRTKSIGFKVSEEEYAQLEEAARAGGFTLGEWCRQMILGALSQNSTLSLVMIALTGDWRQRFRTDDGQPLPNSVREDLPTIRESSQAGPK